MNTNIQEDFQICISVPLFICRIVNIILDYLKKAVHITYLLLPQIHTEVFCKRSPLEFLNKILEKYLRKSSFLVKLQLLKTIHSHVFFKVFAKSLSNLVHDFWQDCFHNPKLLLAANRLICLNNQYVHQKFTVPGTLAPLSFFYLEQLSLEKLPKDIHFMKQRT